MRILLDCRPLQSAGPGAEKSRLIFSAAAGISGKSGDRLRGIEAGEDIEWLVAADRRYRLGEFPALPGRVITSRSLPGVAGWRLWYDRQLRRIVRRHKVDMVWLTGGIPATGIGVPVWLWMPERADPAEGIGPGSYGALYRRRLKSGLEMAAKVICYSERDRAWLGRMRPEVRDRICVMPAFPDETIQPLSLEEKDKIKAGRTEGKDYFLANLTGCGEGAVVDLLKAFSLFKKRQQSRMRLVLTGRPVVARGSAGEAGVEKGIRELLKTYKYRVDVDWAVEAPDGEKAALAGAAYAVLLPAEGNNLGTTLLNTWRAGVPVIAAAGGLLEEMAQGAALEVVPGDPASLAGQLMRIYKEEDLRGELTRRGFERLKVYSRENFLQVLRVIAEIAAC